MASLALTASLASDLIPIEDVAKRLGRSRRTLDRWATSHPDELPRYPQMMPDGTTRTLVSWRSVQVFCINHNKPLSSDNRPDMTESGFTPDPTLSEQIAAPDTPLDSQSQTAQTISANDDQLSDLRIEVSALTVQVAQLSATLEATRRSHLREVSLLEVRIEELKVSCVREITSLQVELAARRGEASEMRQAAERQQQREAVLRWQTATMKGERDQALAELKTWSEASWPRRLFGRPRLPAVSELASAQSSVLLEVTNED